MRTLNLLFIMLITTVAGVFAQDRYTGAVIAESDYQWTGIAVSSQKRIFVNFPSWDVASPYKVAEVVDGKTVAYPSAKDNDRFVCVQSVVIDDLDRLWILDPANPQFAGVVKGGAKLYRVNLSSNKIERTYSFPQTVAPSASYLNDVRIDTKRNIAYMTDSQLGGIVVLDLSTGASWRALDSRVEEVMANLKGINFDTTGFWGNRVNSDGIELSQNGEELFFTALTGDVLYKITTDVLRNKALSVSERAEAITVENATNVATDGMLLHNNKLFMGDLSKEGIWVYDLHKKQGQNIDLGFGVRWADSFAADHEGTIYFTTSQINYPVNQRNKYQIIAMKKKEQVYPKAFSHIGITVPNLDEAVKFYRDVMGWYVIMEPTKVVEEKETAIGQMCIDVFGEGWGDFRIAHLATSDKVGIELFEFKQAAEKRPDFDPFHAGLFHFSVQDPDIEGLVQKIVEAGGKQRMPIREYYPGEKPFKMCYVEDPFGVVFEIYTHSYEMTYSQGAY
ncbi:MAG: lactoylglutathione lyase family protein [Tannerellaceae bacterium]